MAITVQQFVERLTESGLMSAAEVAGFQESLPPDKRPRDVQQFAQVLIQQGKLTKYQAQAVYQGKGKGLVFGQYTVLDQIGEGGMGVVLKARHRRMKRTVAIKVLPPAAMKQAGAVERFQREVQAAAQLSHPNIVTAYDAGEHRGMYYLAMEYIEGHDLATAVKEHGPLEVRQAVECILQAARGLQYAHEQGIIHRDIKPGNLLLDKKGTVKILDMGLARIAGPDAVLGGPERLTTSGQALGTCDYMAPEQALDTHAADHRADIYALGCTLYRLLIGRPPYQAETFAKLFLMHLEAPIPSLRAARPEAPEALDSLCHRMLAKKPEDRCQSMAEVVAELEAVLAVLSGRSRMAPPEPPESSSAALSQTLAFLQGSRPAGTAVAPPKAAVEEETQPGITRQETGTNILVKARRALAKVRRKPLALAGLVGGLLLLLGIILTIILRHGTLTVEIDENLGKDVQVAVSQGGQKVQLVDVGSGWTLSLSAGKYDLAVQGGDDQFQLDSHTITVTRGGQVKVKVTLKPPVLAVAPFDPEKAKEHQAAWAKYLGVPVEMTNSIGMKLVLIPPGEFMMGEGGDAHKVKITKPFYLGKYEVTQEEWLALTIGNPSRFKGPKNPVQSVSWHDCQAYLKKVSEKCGLPEGSYRLPTEAEWEYACRAGSTSGWFFGNSELGLDEYGWYGTNSEKKAHPVGQKKANAWGLYDVCGNVQEWCADWYDKDYYKVSPPDDPAGPSSGSRRVNRGGSSNYGGERCRSARRNSDGPGYRDSNLGLRAALVLAEKPDERKTVPSSEYSVPSTQASGPIPNPKSEIRNPKSEIPSPQPLAPSPSPSGPLKPDWQPLPLEQGGPLEPAALVVEPAKIRGLRSWTIETPHVRGYLEAIRGKTILESSPDGRHLLVAGGDALRVLDAQTLRTVRVLPRMGIITGKDLPTATRANWSPEGRLVAAAGIEEGQPRVYLWDVQTGRMVHCLKPSASLSHDVSICWSPDGRMLGVATWNDAGFSVSFWDVERGVRLKEYGPAKTGLGPFVFLPDGKTIACAAPTARQWEVAVTLLDAAAMEPRQSLGTGSDRLGVRLSPDGSLLVGPEGRNLRCWRMADTSVAYDIELPGGTRLPSAMLRFSRDGKLLAVGDRLYDALTGNALKTVPKPPGVVALDFSVGGRQLAVLYEDNRLLFWDLGTMQVARSLGGHGGLACMLHFARKGSALVWHDSSQYVHVFRSGQKGALVSFFSGAAATESDARDAFKLDISPDGQYVREYGMVWDVATGEILSKGYKNRFIKSQWSPQNELLSVTDGYVVGVSDATGRSVRKFAKPIEGVREETWQWSPDGSRLLRLQTHSVRLFDSASGELLREIATDGIRGAAWAADGKSIQWMVGDSHHGWEVWDGPSGKPSHKLAGYQRLAKSYNAAISGIDFAPSRGIVAIGTNKGHVLLSEVATGKTLRLLDTQVQFFVSPVFTADDRRLWVGGQNFVRQWDVETARPVVTLLPIEGNRFALISPEGHYRGSPGIDDQLLYVALTDEGEYATLSPAEFEKQYGWKNDPTKVTSP
ncbi:MAG: SUMF1/EgtB/PvdO family nonheme iron enzyme [Thermoguttaceae bacterium]